LLPKLLCLIHSNVITPLLHPAAAAPRRCILLQQLLPWCRRGICKLLTAAIARVCSCVQAAHLRVPPLVQPRDLPPLAATTTSAPLPLAGLGLNTELVNEPAGEQR
jgi:hypothetical protein